MLICLCVLFLSCSTVGDDNQSEEVTVTIPVISSWPAPVAIPAEQADDLPASGEASPVTFHLRGH